MREQRPTTPCRACGEDIAFVVTRAGKKMPVNADSLSEEDVELLRLVGQTVDYRHGEHESHFSTCIKADEFRRGR